MAEEELPEELDKLQITPNLLQVNPMDNNLTLALNPFFEGDRKTMAVQISTSSSSITSKCAASRHSGHRSRCASEGGPDELKNSSNSNADVGDCLRTPASGGVLRQSLKKSAGSSTGSPGQRKLVLREPILKALQTCLRPQSTVRRSILTSSGQSSDNDGVLATRGMSDFRDLIHECHSLLTEDVDFSGKLNMTRLCIRNSKNFTTMQTSQSPQNHGDKLRNSRTYQKHQEVLNDSTTSDGGGSCVNGNQHNPKPALNLPRTSLSNPSSPEHSTSTTRCSTSCSQQAGSSAAAACDDVTIDELASYFDTFVHIPKKMSSMAEMMYI